MTINERVSPERLNTIKSWRKKYGKDANVMIPASEAESIISELQQYRAAEPVAWQWFHLNQWHVTNDEERARELAWDGVKVLPLYAVPQLPQPVEPEITSEELDDELLEQLIDFRRSMLNHHRKEGNKVQTVMHGMVLRVMLELQERRAATLTAAPAVQAEQLSGNTEQVSQPYALQPHVYRELVNSLRDTAVKYRDSQQLRAQISNTLRSAIAPANGGNSPAIPDGSEDSKRLDWLDEQNKRLNKYYGTSYGWKFDANFQRNAMMLNDSNYPVMTVRQAIDEDIAAAPKQEAREVKK